MFRDTIDVVLIHDTLYRTDTFYIHDTTHVNIAERRGTPPVPIRFAPQVTGAQASVPPSLVISVRYPVDILFD